jgi:Mn2+/Fe2+ NRAMP family transporter
MEKEGKSNEIRLGSGPPLEILDEVPKPLGKDKLTIGDILRIIGPSAIAVGIAIGGGEWMIGPSLFVKWGLGLLWITTLSCLFQTILNIEMSRYTLYTGEPINIGFMRLPGGGKVWGSLFFILATLQVGFQGISLALMAGTAAASLQLGRIAGLGDQGLVIAWGILHFIIGFILISIGRAIERTLEIFFWACLIIIIGGLLILDLAVVPAHIWMEGFKGFVSFGYIPAGVDVLILGAIAAYSAMGGISNNGITNYYRDKGYAMGGKVGYIPALIGGKKIPLSPSGKVFKINPENIRIWKQWLKLLYIDQWGLFWFGGMIGMLLPGLLAVALLPPGTTIGGWGVAAYQGDAFRKLWGPIGFIAAIGIGWIICFNTQIGIVENYIRQIVDMAWSGIKGIREWAKGDVRRVYYPITVVYMIWAFIVMNVGAPLVLLAISANIANLIMVITALLTIYINEKFLPKEIRSPMWQHILLVFGAIFWTIFFFFFVTQVLLGIKIF